MLTQINQKANQPNQAETNKMKNKAKLKNKNKNKKKKKEKLTQKVNQLKPTKPSPNEQN